MVFSANAVLTAAELNAFSTTTLEVADSHPATLTLKGTNSVVTAGTEVQAIDFYQSDASGGAGVSARIVGVGNNSSGAQNLTFHTGQAGSSSVAERMRIDSNGKVGIGTTSPAKELDVHGTSNPEIRILSTDASDTSLVFGDSVDGARASIFYDTSLNKLLFRGYNNTTRMTISSDGKVGIGTTAPATNLEVVGDAAFTGYVSLSTSGEGYLAADPPTGTGNDAEWAAPLGVYVLRRNSSLAAEKENITADLGEHLTADMIDSVVPKLWNRLNSPGYPEIGPLAEDMDAISPFLAARGTDADNVPFLTGINKTAYIALLVLAVKDLRARVATLEAA